MFKHQSQFANALNVLLMDIRKHADHFPKKVTAMQAIYLQHNGHLYSEAEIAEINHYSEAYLYKFYLATLNLEQLWALSHSKRQELLFAVENSLTNFDCSDDEILLCSFALESFLFQGRAFLDFLMIYLCLIFKTGFYGSMSRDTFSNRLAKVEGTQFEEKARQVKSYFENHVFGNGNSTEFIRDDWGTLLKTLRDKIAHKDRLKPNVKAIEILGNKVPFNWPSLQTLTYDRFCQMMQNGMFSAIEDLSPVIYSLEWKPGPYRPDMWPSD